MPKLTKLIELLPYNPGALITDQRLQLRLLRLLQFLIKACQSATIEFYVKQNLLAFDAHVGENLCQIRACYLLDVINNPSYKKSKKCLNEQITLLKRVGAIIDIEIGKLAAARSIPVHLEKARAWESIDDYLSRINVYFVLSKLDTFLLISFLLTKYRKINDEENMIIDYLSLQEAIPASKHFCRRLVHDFQKILSQASVDYVINLAKDDKSRLLLKLMQHKDDDGRDVLPC